MLLPADSETLAVAIAQMPVAHGIHPARTIRTGPYGVGGIAEGQDHRAPAKHRAGRVARDRFERVELSREVKHLVCGGYIWLSGKSALGA